MNSYGKVVETDHFHFDVWRNQIPHSFFKTTLLSIHSPGKILGRKWSVLKWSFPLKITLIFFKKYTYHTSMVLTSHFSKNHARSIIILTMTSQIKNLYISTCDFIKSAILKIYSPTYIYLGFDDKNDHSNRYLYI